VISDSFGLINNNGVGGSVRGSPSWVGAVG